MEPLIVVRDHADSVPKLMPNRWGNSTHSFDQTLGGMKPCPLGHTIVTLKLMDRQVEPSWAKGMGDEGKFAKLGCTPGDPRDFRWRGMSVNWELI